MKCPKCQKEGNKNTQVKGSRFVFTKKIGLPVFRRTRHCTCGNKWHTYELNKTIIEMFERIK